MTIAVRPFAAHEWQTYRDLRLRALADAPDAFARTLVEEQGRSDAEWSSLLAASIALTSRISLVARGDGRAVGLAYGSLDSEAPEQAHLYSMWVEPAARRCGVGRALVRAVIDWARAADARGLMLQVTEGNGPAVRLYERVGFMRTEELSRLRAGSPLLVRSMRLDL